MNLIMDAEFNEQAGCLISLALITEDGHREFYEVVEVEEKLTDWVYDNVIPNLNKTPIIFESFQTKLRKYLSQFATINVVVNHPEDVSQFCQAIQLGEGNWMEDLPPLTFQIIPDLTSKDADIPHNALSDARATRRVWLKKTGIV